MTFNPANRALNSRADLLRWYEQYAEQGMDAVAALAGYERLPETEDDFTADQTLDEDVPVALSEYETVNKQAAKPVSVTKSSGQPFYYLSEYARYVEDPQAVEVGLPDVFADLKPLTERDLQPLASSPVTRDLLPLAPQSRLRFVLRHYLGQRCSHQLDVSGLVKRVATLKPLLSLPRSTRLVPAGRVCVIVDKNRRTLPFWKDFDALCEQIVRQHGVLGLDIREIENDPFAAYRNWFDRNQFMHPQLPAPDSKVLVLSDAGMIGQRGGLVQQRWQRFGWRLKSAGIEPVLLAPVTPSQLSRGLLSLFSVMIWDRLSRFVPLSTEQSTSPDDERVKRLLALVAVAVQVEVDLLRALVQLLPAGEVSGGIEALVWRHEHVQDGPRSFSIQPEHRDEYQAAFRGVSPDLQRKVLKVIKQYHAHKHPVIWAEEVMLAAPLVNFPLADYAWAEQFLMRFTRDFYLSGGHRGMARFARRHLARFSEEGNRHYSSVHSTLYALGHRDKVLAGEVIPACFDSRIVRQVTQQQSQPVQDMTLVQCGEELWLQDSADTHSGLLFGMPLVALRLASNQLLWGRDKSDLRLSQWSTEYPLLSLRGVTSLWMDTGMEDLALRFMEKPPWAQEVWRDQENLFAALTFAGKRYGVSWKNRGEIGTGCWVFDDKQAPFGFDQYGLYGDLKVKGVTQRFRFIEPGSFILGSPEDEPGREPHESLEGSETQHEVTLTQGFWLADTAVTQSFWEVVTGQNPAHFNSKVKSFRGANRPVETISWDDVVAFIEKLNLLFPELQADFPTEAQWEYACRAGDQAAFNFGNELSLKQVNYSGIYDENGWADEAKQATVDVKSYPPNQWGLYEMHGNVWEWCRDVWQQKIPATPVSDPLAEPEAGKQASHRVVRGGSWVNYGRNCRSAIRSRSSPGDRFNSLGFRLSLGLGATSCGAGSKLAASKTQRVAEQRGGLMEGSLRVLQNLTNFEGIKAGVLGLIGRKK